MQIEYISSDEEDVYMRSKPTEEEVTDIRDLRSDLERFQQEDIVKEALKNDVDLSLYGDQIDEQLKKYSSLSIIDYIRESKNIAHLHLEVQECSSILSEMDGILTKYQTDLDKAVNQIKNLQCESDRIAMRLKNRKEVDVLLREYVDNLIIYPSMVNSLISGEMNDEFFTHLAEFGKRLDFVDCVDVDDAVKKQRSLVKAIEEIKVDFNILRLHCGNRIRDAVFRKFAEIRQDSNIEMFQKEVLLKLSEGMHFLQRHLPVYYEEIAKKYCEIMRHIFYQIFAEYSAAFLIGRSLDNRLKTRLYEIAPSEEVIVPAKPKTSLLKKASSVSSVSPFVLSDRHTVIDFLRSPPLLPSILSEDKTLISYPEFFRSIQRHLIDCSLGEFAFEVLFFDPEDTKMLIEVIGAACEELHLTTVNWVRGSFDVVGVMILCILLQAAVEELAKEGVPILQEFFLNLRSKSMSRFKELMALQIKSVKSVPLQPKNLNVTTEIHPSIKRYADLSCALYVLGLSYDSLISRALWEEPLHTLSLEMVNLLMKLASCVKENKRPSYILNSCLYVADVYAARHVTAENDFTRLYQDRLHLYIEEMMAKHFAVLVTVVDKYSDRKHGVQFTSVESKNIQRYCGGWREAVHAVHERIQQDFQYKAVSVFNMFANEVSSYHAKFTQLLQGTPFAKDVPPAQAVMSELMKLRAEYDSYLVQ